MMVIALGEKKPDTDYVAAATRREKYRLHCVKHKILGNS